MTKQLLSQNEIRGESYGAILGYRDELCGVQYAG